MGDCYTKFTNLETTGDMKVGDDLTVTGDAAVGGNQTVTGNQTVGGSLTVTGAFSAPAHEKWVEFTGIAFDTEGIATGVTVYTLPEGAVLTGVLCEVTEAFAGGTPIVLLGVTGTDDALMAAADVTEGTEGRYYKAAALVGAADGTAIKAAVTNVGTGTAGAATFYGRMISI